MHDVALPAGLVAAAAGYAVLVVLVERREHLPISWRPTLAFFAGIAVMAVALVGPLDAAAHRGFAPHMAQHLLLVSLAAPLLAGGRPLDLARAVVGVGRGTPPTVFSLTCAALVQVTVLMCWHIPVVFEAAARSEPLHAVEHLTMLLASFVLWSQLLKTAGAVRGAALIVLFVIGLPPMAYGVGLAFAPAPWYSTYTLADQQMAGVLMWAYGGTAATVGAVLLFASWLANEQVQA